MYKQQIDSWEIENLCGYQPITTFWSDFTIADKFGIYAVMDTYNRAFDEWKDNYKYLTELVMVLNHKIWRYYQSNEPLARVYEGLWNQAAHYAEENLSGSELEYYLCTTD